FGQVSSRASQQRSPLPPPDGFLPFTLERARNGTEIDYGYLVYEQHVLLGLEQVAQLVDVVSEELGTRGGITTPFHLIRAFIGACADPGSPKQHRFSEEARFAGTHELGMLLRWGLGRLVRIADGQEERGLISCDHYTDFRDSELAADFPPIDFSTFLPPLLVHLLSIVITMLSVLTRLTAKSSTSGHTPPTLSPLFGAVFYALGPPGCLFTTYVYYLRATNAMKHIILSFICFQETPRVNTASMVVTTCLKEWIPGYSIQLADQSSRLQPCKRARKSRILSLHRNSVSTWEFNLGKIVGGSVMKYSDAYRKCMNIPSQFQAEQTDDGRFWSLTNLKWGELDWNDFSSTEFTRSDIAPLSAKLQFSPSMSATISSYQSAEYAKKLKKAPKHIPAFGWDTEPVVGQEKVIEEAFLDVFCDIVCGWASVSDLNECDRECNWSLIEFEPNALLLFEECVPLEYRQKSNRRRLPSLFSPTSASPRVKTKSKKEKTELAKSRAISPKASFKEVEFEGLLRGDGNRKTKVITLGSKETPTQTRIIGSPTEIEAPPPMLQSLSHQSSSRSDDSTLTASTVGGTPSSNRRRFRSGRSASPTYGGSVMGRKSLVGGVPSAEYSSVDFETRLASLDGEDIYEDYPPVDGASKNREVADDAWVDILVRTQERHMADQEYGGRGKGRGEDVDLVSLEVQKALKGVRKMSQSPESQRTERDPARDRDDEEESFEVERVPSRLAMNDFVDDLQQPQYYDHSLDYDGDGPSAAEQSIQALHYDQHESEEEEDEPVPVMEAEEEEPMERPLPPRRPGYFDLHPERRPAQLNGDPAGDDPRARFGHDSDSEDEGWGGLAPLRVPGKTAALIEMYRERERSGSGSGLPVRALPVPTPAAANVVVPPKIVEIPPVEEEEEGEEVQVPPPPRVPVIEEEQGRASLGRYVHGAPSHNVLEEEEEE
ncbi:hypothetical protein IW261DRAFT_1480216, partial [Armillaria novae-zelandiae]